MAFVIFFIKSSTYNNINYSAPRHPGCTRSPRPEAGLVRGDAQLHIQDAPEALHLEAGQVRGDVQLHVPDAPEALNPRQDESQDKPNTQMLLTSPLDTPDWSTG